MIQSMLPAFNFDVIISSKHFLMKKHANSKGKKLQLSKIRITGLSDMQKQWIAGGETVVIIINKPTGPTPTPIPKPQPSDLCPSKQGKGCDSRVEGPNMCTYTGE